MSQLFCVSYSPYLLLPGWSGNARVVILMPPSSEQKSKYRFHWDETVQTHLLKVWEFPSIAPGSTVQDRHEDFKRRPVIPLDRVASRLQSLFDKLARYDNDSLLDKLLTAQKWTPEYADDAFAVYLDLAEVSKKEAKTILKSSLCQGTFGEFAVLSRGERPPRYYRRAVEFFERFSSLVTFNHQSKNSRPYLLHQIPSAEAANKTYLFFADTDGSGMLVKSMNDPEYAAAGGAIDREVEVILLGSFLLVDVPLNAVILEGGMGDPIIDQFGEGGHVFLESLTPNSRPLHKAIPLDLSRIAQETPENLGRMLVFDMVSGAWDRHSGNYLIHDLDNGRRSIQEIDFGLFDPDYWKPGGWSGRDDEFLPSRYASIRGSSPGWDIFRHPRVTRVIQSANREQVQAGVLQALFQLSLGKRLQWFEMNLSERFCKRIEQFNDWNSALRFAFQLDLASLDLYDPGVL